MRSHLWLVGWLVAAMLGASAPLRSQEGAGATGPARRFLAPRNQEIAIRAGRLFDARTGTLLTNQIVLIRGDRIAEVGASVQIPREARVIDLSAATVLPGMIDTHVHVNTGGQTPAERALIALTNAQIDLEAGFTTVLDMDSRGGFNTVDLRDAINAGLVAGPRMQVVGQSLNQRAGTYYPDDHSLRFLEGFTENKNVNSPWLARAAVREAKLHGVDWIKIYTTQDFVGPMYMWKPDATLVASPSLTSGRGRCHRRRGAPPRIEGGMSHLWRRRNVQLPERRCGCAQSSARTRRGRACGSCSRRDCLSLSRWTT